MLYLSYADYLWVGCLAYHLCYIGYAPEHKVGTAKKLTTATEGTIIMHEAWYLWDFHHQVFIICMWFQVMDNYGNGRPSVMKTTRLLLDEDAWRGFYRGFGPRFLNMSLWGTSMIVTYELISRPFFSKPIAYIFQSGRSFNFFLLSYLEPAERLSVKSEWHVLADSQLSWFTVQYHLYEYRQSS